LVCSALVRCRELCGKGGEQADSSRTSVLKVSCSYNDAVARVYLQKKALSAHLRCTQQAGQPGAMWGGGLGRYTSSQPN
jgi:hypothetical protein